MMRAHILVLCLLCVLTSLVDASSSIAGAEVERSNAMIVLLHMHDTAPFFDDLGTLTLANKRRYAIRHGYELVVHVPDGTVGLWDPESCVTDKSGRQRCSARANDDFSIDPRAATFGKIKLARAACAGRAGYWMLWSDADAMIINQSIPLTDVIDDRYDILVSVDWLMLNAGVILMKCSQWTEDFLRIVYDAREFDHANALDQSSFQHHIDALPGSKDHVRYIPKRIINVYPEEYVPGDFILHLAGKLYEATTEGALAIAHQFDILSTVDAVEDIDAFFSTPYFLSKYSGVCDENGDHRCGPGPDDRRLQLKQPLISMAAPNRYKHVGMRYYWLGDWEDEYDSDDWAVSSKHFNSSAVLNSLKDDHDEL